ncbi:MAG: transposase [Bacilli bacterium]
MWKISISQSTIKTTNRIEAVNQKIKNRIRFKQNFPNRE